MLISTLAGKRIAAGAHPQRWRVNGTAAGSHPQRWRVAWPLPVLNSTQAGKWGR
ncbi:hypothetical protein M8494_34060 (plasmid) [Serratia ureilytica]